ncbi:glucose/sorbosone dehydrogenase [Tamaricihabitans halophyticus]|uniref:Glucose/sorbosone dehydrogenase n=2 Tax=Tamaricihabitans halophyticus TaxID=1262583 RepID=A0A4R2QQP5_9PSEU|nr:PQQ-dependent sugar dehydrogenase [Tamaricihabitans halophyticus]TCP52082.1 glucose/sorbosone dehydrogenase [Tamaricihabitans halophyticus]
MGHRSGRRGLATRAGRAASFALITVGALLLTGCADFEDQAAPSNWQEQAELTPEAGPEPQLPEDGDDQDSPQEELPETPESIPPPEGCTDFDPAVLATCLDTVSAVATLPGAGAEPSALAAERKSGRIMRVQQDAEPVQVSKLEVDGSGDGGLTGIALSPTYDEDQLIFAYVTTRTDNRVLRIAPDQPPEPVLTGIPKGSTGNRGALTSDADGALLVATGDGGNANAAQNPKSLAGKVLRIDGLGRPAPNNPDDGSRIISGGLHAPGGVCVSADGEQTWVTDRAQDKDLLYQVESGKPLGSADWTWPDRPGVAGCAVTADSVLVATSGAGNMQSLTLREDGTFEQTPNVFAEGESGYGKLSGVDALTDKAVVASTVNKDGGSPVSSDDRVVIIVQQDGGGGAD